MAIWKSRYICDFCKKNIKDKFIFFEPKLGMSKEKCEYYNFLKEHYVFCEPCFIKEMQKGKETLEIIKMIDSKEEYKKIIKKAAKLPNFSDEELGRRMKEFQKK